MYKCNFVELFADGNTVREPESPELRFLEQVCSGAPLNADEYFTDVTSYQSKTVLDAPQGRYSGLGEIGLFCGQWLRSLHAVSGKVEPVVQTIAGGRSASEVVVHFDLEGGDTLDLPVCVIGDLRMDGKLEGLRIYFSAQWIDGFSTYRAPVFTPTYTTPGELNLLTGYVREYYAMLHNPDSDEALERIVETFEDDLKFGGYIRDDIIDDMISGIEFTEEEKRDKIARERRIYRDDILVRAPKWRSVRFETVIDDGVTCVIEWVLVVNPIGIEHGSMSQSGMAAYKRGKTGRLSEIRICDNLDVESLGKVKPEEITCENFVTAYPFIDYGWLK